MKKVLIAAAATSLFALAGCSNGYDTTVGELQNEVNSLSKQVAQLKNMTAQSEMTSDVAAAAALSAQEEAERANQRLDGMSGSWNK
ncbi:hypothetical protein HGP28_02500 [Vibrio sp. SM6]|uniref:Major outer membrane lipoprotein Lpp n=1 Tax=Vibrio agarilyticus TaxID=2726741 RepID=A0A7X8TNF9_9VIBR|nr:Lpp/OprI family alanine-zipper lipoprotein [Vibrio agarilyticus]NLS11759.1 hypothetical protein [Vibrio agarilyticus]